MSELEKLNKFIENTTSLIRNKSAYLLKQKNKELKKNNPTLYADLVRWYDRIFGVKPELNGCAMTFIEKFMEIKVLTDEQKINRMELRSKLKEGKVVCINSVYYSNKSKHLTNAICDEIHARYGSAVFEYYTPKPTIEDATIIEENIPAGNVKLEDMFTNKAVVSNNTPDFEKMTVAELKQFAKDKDIEITGRRKADIIEEIKAAL